MENQLDPEDKAMKDGYEAAKNDFTLDDSPHEPNSSLDDCWVTGFNDFSLS